jgi:biotin carboxyl carrier protein
MSDAVRVTLAATSPLDAGSAVVVAPGSQAGEVLVDGIPDSLELDRRDAVRVRLTAPAEAARAVPALLLEPDARGVTEVVVAGWRVEVTVESARRAELRERAGRGRVAGGQHGPTEVRAIIPGRVVSVAVDPGDAVTVGQQVLVLEAMKMQNELRAPRDGVVARVAVAAGQTIEVGDLLLVIE